MTNLITGLTSLTGGGANALDSLDGNALVDGDAAEVRTSSGIYHYHLNASSGATENSPYVISPDANAGTKRWILVMPNGPFSQVKASTSAGQSIPNDTPTEVVFGTKTEDTLSEFNTSTGRFTATYDGIYLITCILSYSNTSWSITEYQQILLYKGGALETYGKYNRAQASITTVFTPIFTDIVKLSATEYISIYTQHNQGGAVNLVTNAALNFLKITRLS